MDVKVTIRTNKRKLVSRVSLDTATSQLAGRIPTESVLLMRHCILDGEEYEYDFHSLKAGNVHITVEPLIRADS